MKNIIIFLAVIFFSSPSFSSSCYSMKEAEAEQGIRIHSELMVIGLNCQHLWPKNQKNLYLQYKEFTNEHSGLFSGYENTLIRFYRKAGKGSPEKALHELRTDFANKISKDAAVMRPDAFCQTYAPRIPKAAKMDEPGIRKWASTIFPGHPVSHTICAN
jgi:hypothetical protein